MAEATLLLAEAQLRASIAAVEVARAEVERLKIQLSKTQIVSSAGGRVIYRLAEPGELAAPGQRLLTLIDLTDVYLTIFLPMEEAGRLTIGQEAEVILDALPDRPMLARISFISPRAQFTPKTIETEDERVKFVFRVKLSITDPRGVPLNPGLPASARIALAPVEPTVMQ